MFLLDFYQTWQAEARNMGFDGDAETWAPPA